MVVLSDISSNRIMTRPWNTQLFVLTYKNRAVHCFAWVAARGKVWCKFFLSQQAVRRSKLAVCACDGNIFDGLSCFLDYTDCSSQSVL